MPKYPKKKLAQLVIRSCIDFGVSQVVISPGSRNAPLTLGFVNHPSIETYSIVDERCAAFFAMGMAQQTNKPVVILCTSGSALLNYYPAVAEAYYSKIPLIILSADRPKELIDIGDGQTIRQDGVFARHILFQTSLKSEDHVEEEGKTKQLLSQNTNEIGKALEISISQKGPVHINIPFDEPLYETVDHLYEFGSILNYKDLSISVSSGQEEPIPINDLEKFSAIWNLSSKKMVLVGCNFPDELIQTQMDHLIKDPSVIILTETTSNLTSHKFIAKIDQLIFPLTPNDFEKLQPEILITFGGMIVSKKIKQFLRNFQPKEHWHVDANRALDTYMSLSHHFKISAQLFFSQFFFLTKNVESSFQNEWLALKRYRQLKHEKFLTKTEYSDMTVFNHVLSSLPRNTHLQLANSSVVRYAQLFDIDSSIRVFCNRGTSGIDGSTSTAIGAALNQEQQTVFITGDISFFYDSNALWNNYIPKNFRIILVNNSGGGIFKVIPGPKSSDALEFFETPHDLNASNLCAMYGFDYFSCHSMETLASQLNSFYELSEKPALLEISTPSATNDLVLSAYFKSLK